MSWSAGGWRARTEPERSCAMSSSGLPELPSASPKSTSASATAAPEAARVTSGVKNQ